MSVLLHSVISGLVPDRLAATIVPLLAAGATPFLVTIPAMALRVQVTPTSPHLGDTLVIVAQYDDPTVNMTPVVSMGNRTYQSFLVGTNRFRALLPTTPLDRAGTLQIRVTGGSKTQTVNVKLRHRQFPTQSIWLPPGKGSDGTDYEFDRVDAFKRLVTPQKFWQGAFLRPNQGPITSGYGIRRYYNGEFAKDYYHRGVDYAGAIGSPVVAAAAGRVALVGTVAQGFQLHGNTVGIDHGQGVTSIYLHLSRITVKEGQFVQAGQVIGSVGATGAVTGPHLHWGLYVNGLSVDPVPWRTKGFE
jgi:murein DD-endopeptidase MepM/ murein hydrolase activator NlpD